MEGLGKSPALVVATAKPLLNFVQAIDHQPNYVTFHIKVLELECRTAQISGDPLVLIGPFRISRIIRIAAWNGVVIALQEHGLVREGLFDILQDGAVGTAR